MINENCAECINFDGFECKIKKPAYCLNYDHFQWSPMIQISPLELEEQYVPRLTLDEAKAEITKLRETLKTIWIVAGNLMNPEADKAVIIGLVNDALKGGEE